ncbi:MAG: RluA family pseudouridine synthase [Lewinella sp.]|nr:RluA family pseudouridine synthase [Lewinella sp.]
MSLTILAETKDWLAIDKPAGLNVEQLWDYPSVEAEAVAYLRSQGVRHPYVGIVHRLDRPVSGVLLLAKKKSILKALNEQFRERQVTKVYQAVVEAALSPEAGELRHWLVKDQKGKRALAYAQPRQGAVEACLKYQSLGRTSKGYLLEIEPLSGKFHQIRVQLAAAGAPIVGDDKYGARSDYQEDAIALRAVRLVFRDPGSESVVQIEAPLWWRPLA